MTLQEHKMDFKPNCIVPVHHGPSQLTNRLTTQIRGPICGIRNCKSTFICEKQ